jgi:tRNA(Ile)-lysidine synthase
MIKQGDAVLIGVSGGADSIALVHVMLEFCSVLDLHLGIAHFDHGLRLTESERDARFVRRIANKLNLPFYFEKMDIKKFSMDYKMSIEEAGRTARYNFLRKTACRHSFDKIALGHHKDDMAETILMNILRGSGPQGIAGIPAKRDIIIRPLIGVRKSDIKEFLSKKNIVYATDSSNMDPSFLRNRIRLKLIPLLISDYNSEIVEILNRTADIIRDEQTWIDSIISPLYEEAKLPGCGQDVRLSIPELKKMKGAAAKRIIRKAIFEVRKNFHGLEFKHVEAIFELITAESTKNKQLDLPGPLKIIIENGVLAIIRRKYHGRPRCVKVSKELNPCNFRYRINKPGSLYIKETDQWIEMTMLSENQINQLIESNFSTASGQEAYMDMEHFCFPIIIRSWRPGDRFSPLGLSGSQKVKKFLTNNKVSIFTRKNIAVLESAGKIIWVAGFRIDNSVRLKPGSNRVLRVKLANRLLCKK